MAALTRESIISSVNAYVVRVYGDGTLASYKKAFDDNDADKDGRISTSELVGIFEKADIGSGFGVRIVRWGAAEKTMLELDADDSGFIEWSEFSTVFTGPKA